MAVWLRDLPAALAGWGFKVTEVPGWQTRGHGALARSPRGIVNHWTATPFTSYTKPFPTANLVRDGRSDLPGPLCNLQLGFGGEVSIVAAGTAYHAGTGNRGVPCSGNNDMIGIEAEGNGQYWTPQMLDAYPRLCAALWRWYSDVKLTNIVAHFEWTTRKIDINTWPGGMGAFRAAVQAAGKQTDPDWLEDLVARMTDDQLAQFMRFIDSQNRTWDEKQPSKMNPQDMVWQAEFERFTEANTAATKTNTANLLAEQKKTNELLTRLLAKGGAA